MRTASKAENTREFRDTTPETAHEPTYIDNTPTLLPLWAQSQPLQRRSLRVNQPNDPYESEADAIAEQVTRSPAERVQRRCACGGAAGSEGVCAVCRPKQLQRSSGDGVGPIAPPSVHETLRRPGYAPHSMSVTDMASRLDADFSDVRIHTDAQAAQSAADVDARAYTVGQHIVFGKGEYNPHTESGRHLLAHELTHVVQQREQGRDHILARQPVPPEAKGPHRLNVRVVREGKVVLKFSVQSGGQTPEDKSLGRFGAWLVHTEPKAMLRIVEEGIPIDADTEIFMDGVREPCSMCQRFVSQVHEDSAAEIMYTWRYATRGGKVVEENGSWRPELGDLRTKPSGQQEGIPELEDIVEYARQKKKMGTSGGAGGGTPPFGTGAAISKTRPKKPKVKIPTPDARVRPPSPRFRVGGLMPSAGSLFKGFLIDIAIDVSLQIIAHEMGNRIEIPIEVGGMPVQHMNETIAQRGLAEREAQIKQEMDTLVKKYGTKIIERKLAHRESYASIHYMVISSPDNPLAKYGFIYGGAEFSETPQRNLTVDDDAELGNQDATAYRYVYSVPLEVPQATFDAYVEELAASLGALDPSQIKVGTPSELPQQLIDYLGKRRRQLDKTAGTGEGVASAEAERLQQLITGLQPHRKRMEHVKKVREHQEWLKKKAELEAEEHAQQQPPPPPQFGPSSDNAFLPPKSTSPPNLLPGMHVSGEYQLKDKIARARYVGESLIRQGDGMLKAGSSATPEQRKIFAQSVDLWFEFMNKWMKRHHSPELQKLFHVSIGPKLLQLREILAS